MSKDVLKKALNEISKENPTEFKNQINQVIKTKLGEKIKKMVQEKEKEIFKNI